MLLTRLITWRRSKWLVALVAVIVAGGLASLAGKVETTSEPGDLLPEGAESAAALDAAEGFPSADQTVAITVVWREDGPLSGQELEAVGERARVSEDGSTAVLVEPLVGLSEEEEVERVEELRDGGEELRDMGLETAVTGPAGFAADVDGVFGGINTTLLIGAALIVLVLLIAVYRSPIFWTIPFVTVLLAEGAQRGAQFLLGEAGFAITGQAAGIASVLTFGAATDYALLLVARYREELLVDEDGHAAMRRALPSAAPAIVASASTVVLALLTLLLAGLGSSSALGPLAAAGVALAMLFSLTLLPALLLIVGRRAFWPRIPRAGGSRPDPLESRWGRLGAWVRGRPRAVWLGGVAVLAVMSLGLTQVDLGLAQDEQFATDVEAIEGQEQLAKVGLEEGGTPLEVIVGDPARAAAVTERVEAVEGVVGVEEAERGDGGARLPVAIAADPFSAPALDLVPEVRDAVGDDGLVGGQLAQDYDTSEAAKRDNRVVVPVALAVVALVLVLLLRAIVLPALLIGTVVASFAAAFGVGIAASTLIGDFAGVDSSIPLIAFVFLVALGVDYNIFLVARARQESAAHGTSDGMLRALAATGAVITSAGIVLAGTFSILTLIPFVGLIELGVVIALGVLLDTFIVRSIIVPALVWDVGARVWWPDRMRE